MTEQGCIAVIDVAEDGCLRLRRKTGAAVGCALAIAAALVAAISGRTATAAATLDRAPYGTTQGRQAVDIFTMTNENALRIDYAASTGQDAVVNLTNHSYFNQPVTSGRSPISCYWSTPTATPRPDPIRFSLERSHKSTKGVAEGNAMSAPVCVANAVADARGVAEISLPLTPAGMLAAPPVARPGEGLAWVDMWL